MYNVNICHAPLIDDLFSFAKIDDGLWTGSLLGEFHQFPNLAF